VTSLYAGLPGFDVRESAGHPPCRGTLLFPRLGGASAYFSDCGRLFQANRGRRNAVAVAALGKRAGCPLVVWFDGPNSRRSRASGHGHHCEWQKGCCPAAWSQCRLTGILITKSSGSRRPVADIDPGTLSRPTAAAQCEVQPPRAGLRPGDSCFPGWYASEGVDERIAKIRHGNKGYP